jgi:hypothetical protein
LSREPKAKLWHFFAPQWAHQVILARVEVQRLFEESGITGLRYLPPVLHRKGTPLTTITQLIPATSLPEGLVVAAQERVTCKPNNEESWPGGEERTFQSNPVIKRCGRVKYHVPSRLRLVHYFKTTFEKATDFALSAEWFGSGGAASQQVIVSNKVAKLVLERELRGLVLEPIQLV